MVVFTSVMVLMFIFPTDKVHVCDRQSPNMTVPGPMIAVLVVAPVVTIGGPLPHWTVWVHTVPVVKPVMGQRGGCAIRRTDWTRSMRHVPSIT